MADPQTVPASRVPPGAVVVASVAALLGAGMLAFFAVIGYGFRGGDLDTRGWAVLAVAVALAVALVAGLAALLLGVSWVLLAVAGLLAAVAVTLVAGEEIIEDGVPAVVVLFAGLPLLAAVLAGLPGVRGGVRTRRSARR